MGKSCDIRDLREKVPSDPVKLNQRLVDAGSNLWNPAANENPGALAGATGAEIEVSFVDPEYRIRANRATTLCLAIRETHPDDARQILTAALIDLSAGMPRHTAFGDIREDATWWADMATPEELMEYMAAALRALGNRALCLKHRKQLLVDLFRSLPADDRRAFLSRVDPSGTFTGRRSNG